MWLAGSIMNISQLYQKMFLTVLGMKQKKFFDNVVLKISSAFGKRMGPSLPIKSTKAWKILSLSSCLEDRRGVLIIQCHCILNIEVVEKYIEPEHDTKVSTNQEGTNMVTNNTVSLFYWSILMSRIGSSRVNFIVMVGKDVEDIRIRLFFFTLVHEHILIFDERSMDL